MTGTVRSLALAAAFAAGACLPAAAQSAALERVDSLIAAGDYHGARATLDQWWAERESVSVPGAEQARALMLRAQLTSDPGAAEADYLSIVLGYPLAPDAPRALLRLGQGLLAVDEPLRAAGYLQRLVADYPGRPERTVGLLWLARAHRAARQNAAACAAARDGIRDSGDADLVAMFRVEETMACGGARADVPTTPPATTPPATTPPATTPPATPPPATTPPATTSPATTPPADRSVGRSPAADAAAESGRFAVQTGAYRQQESVDAAVARLRRGGYDPRVVLVPGSALTRVRVGRFATSQEAAAFMARLKRDGFDAVVVADAERERRP